MPVCTEHGCPEIIPASGYCPTHKRQRNKARGSRQQRGYDTDHDRLRRTWLPRVATGKVACPKCGETIQRGEPWDLGHTDARTEWTGPEHVTCNRSEAGRKAHR